jgi:hypothetical protein
MPYVYRTNEIRGNGTAIVALITGLIGMIMTVVTGWIPIVGFFLILLPAALAIIFGFVGRAQARAGAPHGAKAVAGLTCGFVALLLTALMQLCWGLAIGGVVISAAEIAEQTGGIEELKGVGQEIQQRVQAEWTRMKAEFPEIEIDEDPSVPDSSSPSCLNDGGGTSCEEPVRDHRNESQHESEAPANNSWDEPPAEQIVI